MRIYKEYGDNAISYVREDPYRLASDFYGIGFFSADKVALSIGLATDSNERIMAAIKHVLAASREFGHCYLTESQTLTQVNELLEMDLGDRLPGLLKQMQQDGLLMVRELISPEGATELCYYSKTLYFDELYVAKKISGMNQPASVDRERVGQWINRYCQAKGISLSDEQAAAVQGIAGGPVFNSDGGTGLRQDNDNSSLSQTP